MGQYFRFICLLKDNYIQFIVKFRHEGGCKLLEMCYLNNYYMLRMEKLLSDGGLWNKQRVVLAGDYAENEGGHACNLYQMTEIDEYSGIVIVKNINPVVTEDECIEQYCAEENEYQYIVNHDTYQYVDKQKCKKIHPLAILLADGDTHFNESGEWAKQRISVESSVNFRERFGETFTEYVFDESEFEYLTKTF